MRYLAAELGRQNIRVNAISAGPIKTLSAAGIAGFRKMLRLCRRTLAIAAQCRSKRGWSDGIWLCSDLSSGVTGEVVYVDAGYHILGMPEPPEKWE